MKILYYDCFAGISGDMNLAAMIDLGVAPEFLLAELDKLGLGKEFELSVSTDARNGIHGTRVDVHLAAGAHTHDHSHSTRDHSQQTHDHGHQRNFADIRDIIMASSLDDNVKETSLRIFLKVAEAEAKVHGKPVEDVHFHEVGATDSIVDIVGAAICYHHLGVDAVWASPVALGSGTVRCAHGVIPVPAPATVEILEGIPTKRGRADHETTTPTSAAILAALVDCFTVTPAMTVTKTGYGIGHCKTGLPNLTRVHLANVAASDTSGKSQQTLPKSVHAQLLECNIDDMTGEQLGDVMALLMDSGAMDVHFTPIMMKKNRPATQISLLCYAADTERFMNLLFRNTTTLGVKNFPLEKTSLERRFRQVQTQYGPVSVKEALLDGEVLHFKPEYQECQAIARKADVPLAKVYTAVATQG